VGQSLNDITERILAIYEPAGPSFEELPYFCPLSSAVFDDSGDEPFEVRVGDAEVENTGLVVAEIVLRIDDRRIEELKQLQADAVGT
jgi:hypothetical protein